MRFPDSTVIHLLAAQQILSTIRCDWGPAFRIHWLNSRKTCAWMARSRKSLILNKIILRLTRYHDQTIAKKLWSWWSWTEGVSFWAPLTHQLLASYLSNNASHDAELLKPLKMKFSRLLSKWPMRLFNTLQRRKHHLAFCLWLASSWTN